MCDIVVCGNSVTMRWINTIKLIRHTQALYGESMLKSSSTTTTQSTSQIPTITVGNLSIIQAEQAHSSTQQKKIVLYNSTIREGNLQKITKLLNTGADINSTDAHGRTALWWAAFNGDIQLVQYLLDHKADFTIADRHGKTPLDIAVEMAGGAYREPGEKSKHLAIIELLDTAVKKAGKSYQDDINGLAEKMNTLGLHSETRRDANLQASPVPQNESPEMSCLIL
ncbi:MAG: ankyrin repeat domain-containing protein [Nitrososphaerales archaeon]